MKGLNTLIKLHKRKLDELRRKMVLLEKQKDDLERASRKLQQELEDEMKLASAQADMSQFFAGFSKRIQNRQAEIAKEVRMIDRQIAKLNDDIAAEFGELKKFEIAKQNAEKRAADAQTRRDTLALDEIASQQHRRKQQTES